jgi:hypothetical protein
MKRITIAAAVVVVGILATGWTLRVAHAQAAQPVCLHGASETPADAVRRQNAVGVIRAINTAQAQAFAKNRAYLNFRDLTDAGRPGRPAGFSAQLTVEGSTYALVVKDTSDPCGYTLFSDQEGLIYVGSPLQ